MSNIHAILKTRWQHFGCYVYGLHMIFSVLRGCRHLGIYERQRDTVCLLGLLPVWTNQRCKEKTYHCVSYTSAFHQRKHIVSLVCLVLLLTRVSPLPFRCGMNKTKVTVVRNLRLVICYSQILAMQFVLRVCSPENLETFCVQNIIDVSIFNTKINDCQWRRAGLLLHCNENALYTSSPSCFCEQRFPYVPKCHDKHCLKKIKRILR